MGGGQQKNVKSAYKFEQVSISSSSSLAKKRSKHKKGARDSNPRQGSHRGSGEGVGLQKPSTYILNITVPAWLGRLLRFGEEGVAKYLSLKPCSRPDWNRLVSLSWRVVKSRSAASLVPQSDFVNYIENEVVKKFSFGKFLENVAAPRTGKSAGVIQGIIRWIIENDLPNYCVIVIAANRRLAETLYRYAVGAAVSLFRELRRSGIKISRGEFFSKVRIRLYLGSEMSCLMGRKEHYIESCVRSCPLLRLYGKKWKKVPPVPVLDPWLFKAAGYCLFVASFEKEFWYKSIVVVTYHSLPHALSCIERHGIRRVIIVFDEYVEVVQKTRGFLSRIDVERVKSALGSAADDVREVDVDLYVYRNYEWRLERRRGSVSVVRVVRRWNELVDEFEKRVYKRYEKLVEGSKGVGALFLYSIMSSFGKVVDDVLNDKGLVELLVSMKNCARILYALSRTFSGIDARVKIKRLGRWMERAANGMVYSVEDVFAGGRYLRCSVRWGLVGGKEVVYGYYGGGVRHVVQFLLERGRMVGVISTSVVPCEFSSFRILPHNRLEREEIRVDRIRKYVRSGTIRWSPKMFYSRYVDRYRLVKSMRELYDLLSGLVNSYGNHVVVANKMIINHLAKMFKDVFKLDVEVHGDLDRNVVDYVVVKKRDGCWILLVSPHSRVSMGIDPPVNDPRSIVVLYGIRRPPTQYIKAPEWLLRQRLVVSDPDCGYVVYRVVREGDLYVVWDGGERLWVYDDFDAVYDKHLLLQVVGRWYMQNVEFVVHTRKYSLMDLRYYAVDVDVFGVSPSPFYVEHEKVVEVEVHPGMVRRTRKYLLENAGSFNEAVARVVKYEKHDSSASVRKQCYTRLKNVYNSLRYVKKQLRYRSLSYGEEWWWFASKISIMINGFEYAHEKGLTVPDGLKRFYKIYRGEGVEELLEELRKWLGVDGYTWRSVVRKLVVVYGVRSLYLEYRYCLRKVPRDRIIVGVNDGVSRTIDSYIPVAKSSIRGSYG